MTSMSDAAQWARVGTAVRVRMTTLGITESEITHLQRQRRL